MLKNRPKYQYESLNKFKAFKKLEGPVLILGHASDFKKGRLGAVGGALPKAVSRRLEKLIAAKKDSLSEGSKLLSMGLDKKEQDIWIAALPEKLETFHLLGFARDCLRGALSPETKNLTLVIAEAEATETIADAFGSAIAARIFLVPVYGKRKEKEKSFQLSKVLLVAKDSETLNSIERGHSLGDGTNLARYLATLPPNILTSGAYGTKIKEICAKYKLGFKFYSNRELKKMGAGAFTAVDQADPNSKGGIYELTYQSKKSVNTKNKKAVHLVGKGLCFDTGGYDVKTNGYMRTMKGDMQGSAIALSALVVATILELPIKLKAFLAVTENHLSPLGFKADEVVTALNGLSIEIINTDAEGRMVLADALTLASREQPECVVDFATLTGSAVRALGTKIAAGFTNRKELHSVIVEAGEKSGERVWTFPLDSTYFKALESDIADTLQCTSTPGPDHILAACFLSKFLKEGTPWVHVDLTPAENKGGLAHVDSMFTGFGVRWVHEFLKEYL